MRSPTCSWPLMLQILCKLPWSLDQSSQLSGTSRVAGSETTATALSAINYYLIRTPHARKLLQDEIRSSFKSYEDINATSTAPLKYMDAVCKEAMRMYAPLPLGLPRVVPPGGDTVDGEWLPGGVRDVPILQGYAANILTRPSFLSIL